MYRASPQRYSKMKYRRCGKSGLLFPAISLGLWHNFGEGANRDLAENIILEAFDSGICHFDLANNYGPPPGYAEETFGSIFTKNLQKYRDEILISTKAGHDMWAGPYGTWNSKKSLSASLDQSLQRLKVGYVDIFYSHRFDPNTPLEETLGALAMAVQQGKALYVGISKYPLEATRFAANFLKELHVPLIIHQTRYNLLQNTPDTDIIPLLKSLGLGMIAFCPLAQGLLTPRYLNGIPPDSRAASNSVFLSQKQVKIQAEICCELNKIAQQRRQTLAQMALSWVLRDETVCSAIIGVSRISQLKENLFALDNLCFSSDEILQIEHLIRTDVPILKN